jgi:hypothetical protein
VLAHLEHLDFPSLLEHLDGLHVLLLDGLDGDLEICLFVLGQFDQTKLALAESIGEVVIVKQIGISD